MKIIVLAFFFASCVGLGYLGFKIRVTSNGYKMTGPTLFLRFVCLIAAFACLALALQRLGVEL